MVGLAFLLIGLILGYTYRDLRDFVREVRDKPDNKPETGVTPGLYHKAYEGAVNQGGETGFVSPKTPQLLEFEENERLKEMQYNVKVK